MKAPVTVGWPVPPSAMLSGCAHSTESVPLLVIGPPVTLNSLGIERPTLVTVPPPADDTRIELVDLL